MQSTSPTRPARRLGATFNLTFGGVDTSTSQTFTLTVLYVNQQPSFTASNPPDIDENNTAGQTVSGWATFVPGGAGQNVLQYIISGVTPGFFTAGPAVDTSGNLTYTLLPNVAGTPNFTVQVQDNAGQQALAAAITTAGSGYNVGDLLTVQGGTAGTPAQLQVTSVGAGGAITGVMVTPQDGNYTGLPTNPVSVTDTTGTGSNATFTLTFGGVPTSAAQTFALTVLYVNQEPSFTASNPPDIVENTTTAQTVNGWATFVPGAVGQSVLQYIVSGVTTGFFSAGPTVDTSGNLHYTLLPDVSGTPTFTVQVQNTGGRQALTAAIAAGGSGYKVGDLLTVQGGTFSTPAQLVVTSIGAGGTITGVAITAQDGDYTALPTNPVSVVDTTTAGAAGATFTLTFGGIDTSTSQTFTLTGLFVNQQPSFTAGNPPEIVEDNTTPQTVSGWVSNFNPGGANDASQGVLKYIVSGVTPGFFSAGPAIDTSGNLTYTLLPDISGTPNFTVQVQDNGGRQALAAAIANTGSGYNVGDLLTVQGGTFSTPAQLEVTSIGAGGTITGVMITAQDGDYTGLPTNPVSVTDTTTPAASGATFTLTFGGVDTSPAQTFALTVLFVNHQPSFTASNPPDIVENTTTPQTVSGWASFNPGGPNDAGQGVLKYTVSGVTPGFFSAPPTVDNNGNLHYTLLADTSGTPSFTVQVQDNGGKQVLGAGIAAGGSGYKVGDLLTLLGGTFTTAAQLQVTSIGPGGAITGVVITSQDGDYTVLPSNPAVATDATTVGAAGATFNLSFGGVDTSATQTFTLTALFVNQQPSFTANNPPEVTENTTAPQTVTSWASFNPGGPNDASQSVLQYSVSGVTPGFFSSPPAVDNSGNLTYTLLPDVSGTPKFTVQVQDNGGQQALAAAITTAGSGYAVGDVLTVQGGTAFSLAQLVVTSIGAGGAITGVAITAQDGAYTVLPTNPVSAADTTTPTGLGATFTLTFGGVDTSVTQNFTLTVLFVNQQPSFTAINPPDIVEDTTTPQTVSSWASFNPGGANDASQSVLKYAVSGVTPGFFSTPPAVNTSGNLTYTLLPDVAGTPNFTVQVQDNGGKQALTVSLVAVGSGYKVGDLLTVQGGIASTAAQLQVLAVGTGGFITAVAVAAQDGAYSAIPANPVSATDTTTPAGSGALFNLSFGGVDTSVTQTFGLTVLFVNDQPSFTASNPPAVNGNISTPQTVNGWASFNPGANDASLGVLKYIVSNVTSGSLFNAAPTVDASGNLHYTLNPNVTGTSTFQVQVQDNGGTQALAAALVTGGSGYQVGDLLTVQGGTFDPSGTPAQLVVTSIGAGGAITGAAITAQDGNYLVVPTNPVSVTDTTTPAASGATFNLTIGGVDTSVAQTFTLTVKFVNEPPSFSLPTPPPATVTVLQDAGPQTVHNFATNILPGPGPAEAGLTVSFIVTNVSYTDPYFTTLFSAGPAISPTGTLTFTTAPFANGSATITVVAMNNGVTTNGGVATSAAQTFVIDVTPVNDPPTFALEGNSLSVPMDSGLQTVSPWATNISAGPPDQVGQTVTFNVTTNNNNLFAATGRPAIDTSGNLTYTPLAHTVGSATVTVIADNHGGGNETSSPQTFVITVTPDNSTVTVSSNVGTAVTGQLVTFTATVASAGPSTLTPSGTVDFVIDGTTVATGVPLVNGQAQYQNVEPDRHELAALRDRQFPRFRHAVQQQQQLARRRAGGDGRRDNDGRYLVVAHRQRLADLKLRRHGYFHGQSPGGRAGWRYSGRHRDVPDRRLYSGGAVYPRRQRSGDLRDQFPGGRHAHGPGHLRPGQQ